MAVDNKIFCFAEHAILHHKFLRERGWLFKLKVPFVLYADLEVFPVFISTII